MVRSLPNRVSTIVGGVAVDFSVVGRALAAPARSAMLDLLMDGSSRPASELAAVAAVQAPTASEHLGVLVDAGLVRVEPRGRQRLYRLTDATVGTALEQLGHLCPPTEVASLRHSREQRDLARARLCYDHLAGRLGVGVTDAFVARGWLNGPDLTVTDAGRAGLSNTVVGVDVDIDALAGRRRPLSRACADWTERRPHLAGSLGAAVASVGFERGWIRRRRSGRGLDVTSAGERMLRDAWGVTLAG